MRRIKQSEIKEVREQLLKRYKGECKICGLVIPKGEAVLDHCHTTGIIRGAIHRSCNSFLGKLENNYKRMGMSELQFECFVEGAFEYLFTKQFAIDPPLLHPLHKKKQVAQFRKLKAHDQILELIKLGVYRKENPPRNQAERVKIYSKLI